MLFDLRARGRRRTVQIVYVGLVLLFLVGFIGFGVGWRRRRRGPTRSHIRRQRRLEQLELRKQISEAEKRTQLHPNEAAAWAALAEARFHKANGSEFYDEEKQQFTAKGKEQLTKVRATHGNATWR